MEITCVIPARINSTRFPQKLLHLLDHRPVIVHTVQKAIESDCFSEIICLTDSPRIKSVLKPLGIPVQMTGPADNGTDRIARNLDSIKGPVVINLQGDEPCFPIGELQRFTEIVKSNPEIIHIMHNPVEKNFPGSPSRNSVKVLLDPQGRVLDFGRSPDPHKLNKNEISSLGIQMGIYAYPREFLRKYKLTPPSAREVSESHELLRILPLPVINAVSSNTISPSLNVKADLKNILFQLESDKHLAGVQ